MSFPKPIFVREVYQENFESESKWIRKALDRSYTYVSIDTEFPGTVFRPRKPQNSPKDMYLDMKINVELTKLIQLGLTLSDAQGNLPHFGTNMCYIWEFNFKDFDVTKDLHNKDSIEMLRKQGINFEENRELGIDSKKFPTIFQLSDLVMRNSNRPVLTWVTFQSLYDFGYLIRILEDRPLPCDMNIFLQYVRKWFGFRIYDIKELMRNCKMYGGLEKMADSLKVYRVVGKRHQAGSDSLLTMHTFLKFRDVYFDGDKDGVLNRFDGKLYGLQGGTSHSRLFFLD